MHRKHHNRPDFFTTATFSLCGSTHILTACCTWSLCQLRIYLEQYYVRLVLSQYSKQFSQHFCLKENHSADYSLTELVNISLIWMLFWLTYYSKLMLWHFPMNLCYRAWLVLSSIFYISALTTALVVDMFWGCPSFSPILKNTVPHKHSLGLKGQLTRFWCSKVRERIHCHLTTVTFGHNLRFHTLFYVKFFLHKCLLWQILWVSYIQKVKCQVHCDIIIFCKYPFFGHNLNHISATERDIVTLYYI